MASLSGYPPQRLDYAAQLGSVLILQRAAAGPPLAPSSEVFARFVPDSVVRRLITGDDKASRRALGPFGSLGLGELLGDRRHTVGVCTFD